MRPLHVRPVDVRLIGHVQAQGQVAEAPIAVNIEAVRGEVVRCSAVPEECFSQSLAAIERDLPVAGAEHGLQIGVRRERAVVLVHFGELKSRWDRTDDRIGKRTHVAP